MSKIQKALNQIEELNSLNQRDQWMNAIHPLVKLSLAIIYIAFTVSYSKYMLNGLIAMAIYPIFAFYAADLSFKDCLYRLRLILPVVCIVGIFNPIFDRQIVVEIGGIGISAGWLSMLSLMIKGIFTVLSVYILVATTSIEEICYALRLIHIPTTIVTVVLLIYRYLFMLFKEAEKITIAYKLRAPGQSGIHYKAWGSLVGQMLIRSMDRASSIYESMELRGFSGEFVIDKKQGFDFKSIFYLLAWIIIFYLLRHTDILTIIGNIFIL